MLRQTSEKYRIFRKMSFEMSLEAVPHLLATFSTGFAVGFTIFGTIAMDERWFRSVGVLNNTLWLFQFFYFILILFCTI